MNLAIWKNKLWDRKLYWHMINPFKSFSAALIVLVAIIAALPHMIPHLKNAIYWTAAIGIVAFFITKHFEKRGRRYNALCRLEQDLNQAMEALSNNIQSLQKLIDASMPILAAPLEVSVNGDNVHNLGRIDIKNRAALLITSFGRINHDLKFVSNETTSNAEGIIQNIQMRAMYLDEFKKLLIYCQKTFVELKQCLAAVRCFIRIDKPLYFFYLQPYFNEDKIKNVEESELQKLQDEIEEFNKNHNDE